MHAANRPRRPKKSRPLLPPHAPPDTARVGLQRNVPARLTGPDQIHICGRSGLETDTPSECPRTFRASLRRNCRRADIPNLPWPRLARPVPRTGAPSIPDRSAPASIRHGWKSPVDAEPLTSGDANPETDSDRCRRQRERRLSVGQTQNVIASMCVLSMLVVWLPQALKRGHIYNVNGTSELVPFPKRFAHLSRLVNSRLSEIRGQHLDEACRTHLRDRLNLLVAQGFDRIQYRRRASPEPFHLQRRLSPGSRWQPAKSWAKQSDRMSPASACFAIAL